MIYIYALISLLIAWIWVDYFRLIDIYEKEDLKYVLLVFILGGLSVFVVIAANEYVIMPLGWRLSSGFFNDLLYCIISIGLVEELAKIIPFLIFFRFFKNQVDEPIDILFYCTASALGFAAVENTSYFYSSGPEIITGRAILPTFSHIFNTGIVAYGIIRVHYLRVKREKWRLLAYFLLAATSHGFYDFWLMYKPFNSNGWIVSVAYFMLTVSLFAGILNNAINHSKFFHYEKVISANKVLKRLFGYYAVVFMAQAVLVSLQAGFIGGFKDFLFDLFTIGAITMIVIIRLSRFTLVKKEWAPLPFSFPFRVFFVGTSPKIDIAGSPYEDKIGQAYFRKPLIISPISPRSRTLRKPREAILSEKHWLEGDEPCYLGLIENNKPNAAPDSYIIREKTKGERERNGFPMVSVLKLSNEDLLSKRRLKKAELNFVEWAYVRESPGKRK